MPIMLDGLSVLSEDILDKDKLYSLLLVLSGILTDKNGNAKVNAGVCVCVYICHLFIYVSCSSMLNMLLTYFFPDMSAYRLPLFT